jgi:hypothetical protein
MKKAVVFYGSMRELEMGSKSWHVLGEDVDYFVVTWGDVVNNHITDNSGIPSYPCDLSNFPVPIVKSVTPNFAEYNQSLQNTGLPTGASLLYVLYHWSLIGLLSGIHTYDQIIIARTDMFSANMINSKWEPNIIPGKVTFSGNHDCVNDWIVTTDPAGLATLYDMYHHCINTRDCLDEFGQLKIIHNYLYERIQANPEKFNYGKDVKISINHENLNLVAKAFNFNFEVAMAMPPAVLIRPNYPKAWLKIPYGPVLAYLLTRHSQEYEIAYNRSGACADEAAMKLLSSTEFKL